MRLSASRLELGSRCLWWARPGFELPEPDGGDEARLGLAVDGILSAEFVGRECNRAVVANQNGVTLAEVTPLVDTELTFWEGLRRREVRTQVAFAYDPHTGKSRELGSAGHRDYSMVLPHEIPGTVDVVARRDDGILVVTDWKSGQATQLHVPPVDRNRQLRFLGLCAARAMGEDEVAIEVHRIRAERVDDDGTELDALSMASVEAEVEEMASKVSASAKAKAGLHCVDHWCPALSVCDAAREEAGQIVPVENLVRAIALDPKRAVVSHALAKKLLDRHYEELKLYADDVGGIPLDEGYAWSGRDVAVGAHFRRSCVQRRYDRRKVTKK